MDNFIRYCAFALVAVISFAAIYISFNTQQRIINAENKIEEYMVEQDKIKYLIENKLDTIVINNYINIKK